MHKTTLAIVDANIRSGQDEVAREDVLARLRNYADGSITPLWVNWLRERADLRIVCLVRTLDQLDDFLIDVLRDAVGVAGTQAVLSFGGKAHIARLMDLPLATAGRQRLRAAQVNIDITPGYDRSAFDALWLLPAHRQVQPVWLLRTYHSFGSDLTMLLLSSNDAATTGFVMSWVRTVEGVADTSISSIADWEMLATPDQLIEVAEEFFHLQFHDKK